MEIAMRQECAQETGTLSIIEVALARNADIGRS